MPASGFDVYHIHSARSIFHPTGSNPGNPGCSNANEFSSQCQPIHISTNRYYGFHHTSEEVTDNDSEMRELQSDVTTRVPNNARKRSANGVEIHQSKRLREENMVPSPSTHSPCLLQPTHNNPDLSRCLMVHMI